LFDQTFVDTRAQTHKPWTVAASLALQLIFVAAALLAPLSRVAVLERPESVPVWLPLQTIKRPLESEERSMPRTAETTRPVFQLSRLQSPTTIPKRIDMAPDAPGIPDAAVSASTGTSLLESLTGTSLGTGIQPPPLTQAVSPKLTPPPVPILVTGGVQSAKLVFGPRPAYPPLARDTRTQGVVKIQAVIGRDGSIRNLQVLSGPPLLIGAAMAAVQQWRYQPTLLNGQAVEVLTEIDVNFVIRDN
jgi:periplasmic protein TonB